MIILGLKYAVFFDDDVAVKIIGLEPK